MDIKVVPIDKPEDMNVILGQAHFIKTVEDLHEALIGSPPHLRFGLAFCEASGPRLVRRTGNEPALVELAVQHALAIGAGHSFVVLLRAAGIPARVVTGYQGGEINPRVPEVRAMIKDWVGQMAVREELLLRVMILGAMDGQQHCAGVLDPRGIKTDRQGFVTVHAILGDEREFL